MTKRDNDHYRQELNRLLRRLRPDVTAIADQALAPSGGQGDGELSNAPLHLGEGGTADFLHDLNATLLENEEFLATEVEDALERLESGGFGQCEACGKPIGKARLDVVPYARFCVACADAAAPPVANLNAGRPRTPADTLAPEGQMGEDWHEAVGPLPAGLSSQMPARRVTRDSHAVGEPGGGSALGGLAGSNEGSGEPEAAKLQQAAASGQFDHVDDAEAEVGHSGPSGGAVGGTPANKRAR